MKKSKFTEVTSSYTYKHTDLKAQGTCMGGGIFWTGITSPFSLDGTQPEDKLLIFQGDKTALCLTGLGLLIDCLKEHFLKQA